MNKKCQVFTPSESVKVMLDSINYSGASILRKYILENSCGEGNILKFIVKRYIEASINQGYTKQTIRNHLQKYIIGFEIDPDVRKKCIDNLTAVSNEFSIGKVNWNIKERDYLNTLSLVEYDFIVGNPPYISYHEIVISERERIKNNFVTCRRGKFDYCYAFIEKSLNELSNKGQMIYLVPNSIFKTKFGEDLREYMLPYISSIKDYKEHKIFKNALTSSAIIHFRNGENNSTLIYEDVVRRKKLVIKKSDLKAKWIFKRNKEVINKKNFSDYFKVGNSVATLRNDVFVIPEQIVKSIDMDYVYLEEYKLEKSILLRAASPKRLAKQKNDFIIFPYYYIENELKRYTELEFENYFPETARYLKANIEKLAKRKTDKFVKWYEYGKSQALQYLNVEKLNLSSVITNKVNVYVLDKEYIPYSGFYVISKGVLSIDKAKEILESKEFYDYIKDRGINISGTSIRCSVNDLLDFPIDKYLDCTDNIEESLRELVYN